MSQHRSISVTNLNDYEGDSRGSVQLSFDKHLLGTNKPACQTVAQGIGTLSYFR